MNKYRYIYCSLVLLLLSAFTVPAVGCSPQNDTRLKVVSSTSLISYLVERIGGDRVNVVNIIPPAQCPGNFDIKPGDVQNLAKADLFLMHGWQGEKFSSELIASARNSKLVVTTLNINGNWMVPSIQIAAAEKVADSLCRIDPPNCEFYSNALTEYKTTINKKELELKSRLDPAMLSQTNVICADQLEGFIKWMGLNVVAVYGAPETLTPGIVKYLVDKGRQSSVVIIIDNLQSGENAGKGIAEELKCKRVVLTNFPGGFNGTETWEKAIDKDVDVVLKASVK